MNRFTRKPKRFSLALHLRKCRLYSIDKDISSINFFCQDVHESLKYVDELFELKNDEIQKEHASLSLLVDR